MTRLEVEVCRVTQTPVRHIHDLAYRRTFQIIDVIDNHARLVERGLSPTYNVHHTFMFEFLEAV